MVFIKSLIVHEYASKLDLLKKFSIQIYGQQKPILNVSDLTFNNKGF